MSAHLPNLDRTLHTNGAVLVKSVLPLIRRTLLCDDALERLRKAGYPVNTNGISVTLAIDPAFHKDLIHYGMGLLRAYGVPDVRYLAGAIIPRYPGEPARPWHVDWFDWDSPETRWDIGPQYGVIFYLDAANEQTGQLIIQRGSHRANMDKVKLAGTTESCDNQLSLPAAAGDAIIIDARTLHGVTQTFADKRRMAITLWYLSRWGNLSEQVRSTAMLSMSREIRTTVGEELCPNYAGTMPPKTPVPFPQNVF